MNAVNVTYFVIKKITSCDLNSIFNSYYLIYIAQNP